MADEFAAHDCKFVFVYTREAHPSDRFPAHTSLQQKLEHARAMVDRLGMKRLMLVDDLEGTVHQAYGCLPNMTYIIKSGGIIVYRASWTEPTTVRLALERILYERTERRARRRITPYYLEWLPQRANDRAVFMQRLFDIGERAVAEFVDAVEHSEGESAARPLKEWWSARRERG
jgi:hypothetical protein